MRIPISSKITSVSSMTITVTPKITKMSFLFLPNFTITGTALSTLTKTINSFQLMDDTSFNSTYPNITANVRDIFAIF